MIRMGGDQQESILKAQVKQASLTPPAGIRAPPASTQSVGKMKIFFKFPQF